MSMTQAFIIVILILLANEAKCRIYCNTVYDCLFCGCQDYIITSCNYVDYYWKSYGYFDQPANFIEGEVSNICIQAEDGWPQVIPYICSRRGCPTNLFMDKNCMCVGCPVGSYCTNNTQNLCPAGTYNPNLNSSNAADCLPCPMGTYNENNGLSVCFDCPVSHYQNNNGRTSCFHCNVGTYTVSTGSQRFSDCIPCPAGFACPAVGPMYSCTNNVDFSLTGQSNCTPCASTCANGLMEATPCTTSTNRVCKIPVQLTLPKSCDIGMDCVNYCPDYQGSFIDYVYCSGVHDQGGFSPGSSISFNRYEYQFDNTSNLCLQKTYKKCSTGFCDRYDRFCYNQTKCIPCAPGFYIKSTNCVCYPCPANSYCNGVNATVCDAACAPGDYEFPCSPTTNRVCYNIANCTPCAPGFHIKSSNCVCTPCPANSYCNGVNATICAATCAPGNYESVPCSPTTNRVCKACDLCTSIGQYRMNCGGSSAGTCTSCTNPI